MDNTITVDGKKLLARPLKADEWFDALELTSKREQDYALIAAAIVDSNGHQAYTVDEIGALPVPTYAKLYQLTVVINRVEDVEKK